MCALKGKARGEERGRKEGRTTFETDRYETAESFPELLDSNAPPNLVTDRGGKVSRKSGIAGRKTDAATLMSESNTRMLNSGLA